MMKPAPLLPALLAPALALFVSGARARAAVVQLAHEHTDIRLTYDSGASPALGIVLRYNNAGGTHTVGNRDAYLVGTTNSLKTIPASTAFAFLGPAGSPIWILPQLQDPARIFLGVSTESIPTAAFTGNLELRLKRVEGPGNFFAWQTPGPVIRYQQTNGVIPDAYRSITLPAGFHDHFNWGFSSTGLYHVTLQALGRRVGEATNLVSAEVTFAFQILPLRPYESWACTNWPPAEPARIIGRHADPDGDGAVNLWEYAGSTHPADPASEPANPRLVLVESGGVRHAELRWERATGSTDVAFRLAIAENASGPYVPLAVPVSVIQSGGATQTVAMRDPLPAGLRPASFYRWLVESIPPAYW